MFNILVLGNLPLATKILRFCKNHDEINILGAVTGDIEKMYPSTDNEECARNFCIRNSIAILNLNEITSLKGLDLIISARNNDILSNSILNHSKLGVINCHGGLLPNYKGVGGHIFPIVNNETHTGASLHWMTSIIDGGDIIDYSEILIHANDTGLDLFLKINNELAKLVTKNIMKILLGTSKRKSQTCIKTILGDRSFYYYKRDVLALINKNKKSKLENRALVWVNTNV